MGFRLVVCLLAVILAGCSGDDDTSPAATVPRVSTTVSVADVPDVVEVEYVQRVMDELDQVLGDAIRAFVAANGPNKEFYDRLRAVYDEPAFTMAEDDYGRFAVEGVREVFQDSPGNPTTRVLKNLDSSRTCVVISVDRTFGAALRDAGRERAEGLVQLVPKRRDRDPAGLNATAWAVVADGHPTETPVDPCP